MISSKLTQASTQHPRLHSTRDLSQPLACVLRAYCKPARPAVLLKAARASAELQDFEKSAVGEWEGASATFSQQGTPLQLPDSLIPQALRSGFLCPVAKHSGWCMTPAALAQTFMHASSSSQISIRCSHVTCSLAWLAGLFEHVVCTCLKE